LLYIGIILVPLIVALLFTYQIIIIPIPTDMKFSPAIGYQEGPRRAPPAESVPIGGQSVIPGEFPENPIPADPTSLQRGEILYDIHCALCHGAEGTGDGPLAIYFERTPENLVVGRAAAEFDGSVYLAILQGFGEMPSLAESLTARERWDVINYVRTLPGPAE
jgi:mono/diheme cytochrome c family protein